MKLCKFCNSSKNKHFKEGSPCFICGDALLSLQEIAKKAIVAVPAAADTFSIATSLPNEWLAKEEFAWDQKLQGTVSIKTAINLFLNGEIRKATGKKPKSDGDITISASIPKGDISIRWNDLFIFGKYKKLVAGMSQTRWVCSECEGKGCEKCGGSGKFYRSIEEEIGEVLKEMAEAEDYKMHASGREDIDVRNEGRRPFIMQLIAAKNRKIDLGLAAKAINEKKNVEVGTMTVAKRGSVEVVAASHFDKTYIADVEFEREVRAEDIEGILALRGKYIKQKTPRRVEHRRAFIERRRKILDIRLLSRNDRNAGFLITAEAGTYIKELINGDEGRTNPSFSSITKMKAICKNLSVHDIKDDFLDTVKT